MDNVEQLIHCYLSQEQKNDKCKCAVHIFCKITLICLCIAPLNFRTSLPDKAPLIGNNAIIPREKALMLLSH